MNIKFFLRLAKFSFIFIMICSLYSSLVHASYSDEWLRKQKEADEKYMNELEKDGNLTQEAIDSISKGSSKRKPNKSTAKRKSNEQSNKQSNKQSNSEAKGWVYGADELHVTGLPTDERGYTQAGNYGDIPK